MQPTLLANVAIDASSNKFKAVLTYRVPWRLQALACLGQLVWVPLQNRQIQGIIIKLYKGQVNEADEVVLPDISAVAEPDNAFSPLAQEAKANAPKLRDISDVADPDITLTPQQITLAKWVSSYYRNHLYDALTLMLPPGVEQNAETRWKATGAGLDAQLGALPERERAVLYFLRQNGATAERDLRKNLRGSDSDLRQIYGMLQERGLITRSIWFQRPQTRPKIEHLSRLVLKPAHFADALAELKRAPRQQAILQYHITAFEHIGENQAIPLSEVYKITGATREMVRNLERRGFIEVIDREVRRDPLAGDNVPPDVPPTLTRGQERVWQPISAALDAIHPEHPEVLEPAQRSFLLHGVTGSGKTEIYLRAIGRAMRHDQQTLVLVPEIALTAQLVRRFAARFPGKLAVLHSALGDGERYDEWRRLRSGDAMLAIGSRSAVFAPLPKLGLIIVDEEHEGSYKSDASPRYHARDTAQQLAELSQAVLILGSATPAVESYTAAKDGRITLLELHERVGMQVNAQNLPQSVELPLPPIKIVDMRKELQQGNRSIFSRPLQIALHNALERKQQAILFLNRRGAAAFVMCRDCGHVVSCPNCSSPLVMHYDDHALARRSKTEQRYNLLICHSCNHRELMPSYCPECWSPRIKSFGVGTQRVVEEVEEMFPEARTLRWDRDSVTRKGEHERMLDRFLNHEADILVGTQMIAKGLDLPMVSVVGVVAADTGLHLPDFRAGEKSFQLLTQVAGRAGRRSEGAQVVLQTYNPDHYALLAAQEHDYRSFYQQEIAYRRQIGYPPFSQLLRFVYSNGNDASAQHEADDFATYLRNLAAILDLGDWSLIGPAPAFFHRQRNRFRWHIMVRAENIRPLIKALNLPPGWIMDVDPVNVL
jgi:primosomal protein N' (replication factor Y)